MALSVGKLAIPYGDVLIPASFRKNDWVNYQPMHVIN